MRPAVSVWLQDFLSSMSGTLRSSRRGGFALLLSLLAIAGLGQATPAFAKPASQSFDLVASAGAAACLPDARGTVRLTSHGSNQRMDVYVSGLPADITLTVFALQLPHPPFGLSWYQGDIRTDESGEGHARFIGIFSDETFIVAPGVGSSPAVHANDAIENPQTAPVHTFHVGMWFDSTADAAAAGCAANQTPFNGSHAAGIQVLNTAEFPDGDGPIGQFAR